MTNYEEVYQKIEELALANGYFVYRFTREFPIFKDLAVSLREPVHYIHVNDGQDLILSIFYDKKCAVNTFFGEPNYELYYGEGSVRFPDTEDSIKKIVKYANRCLLKLTLL